MKITLAVFAALAGVAVAAPQPQGGPPPTNPPTVTNPGRGPPTQPPTNPPGGNRPPRANFIIQVDAPDWAGRDGMDGRWIRPEADPESGVNYLTVNKIGEGKSRNFWFGRSPRWDNGLGNVNYVISGVSLWGGFLVDHLTDPKRNEWPVSMANKEVGNDMFWFEDTFFTGDGHWQRLAPGSSPPPSTGPPTLPPGGGGGSPPGTPLDKWALCWVQITDAFERWKKNDRLALHWFKNKEALDTNVCWPVKVRVG